jgi:hypothetical protein
MLSGGTRQDSKIKPANERHSLSVTHKERDSSSRRKKENEQVETHILSNAEKGSRRTARESQRARSIHKLSNEEGETSQDDERGSSQGSEIMPTSEENSRTVEDRARKLSGQ